MIKPRRFLSLVLAAVIILSGPSAAFAYSPAAEYLTDVGINFYHYGRYDDALQQFYKAILIEPDYQPAIKYIRIIEKMAPESEIAGPAMPSAFEPRVSSFDVIEETLQSIELQREMVQERGLAAKPAKEQFFTTQKIPAIQAESIQKPRKNIPAAPVYLDIQSAKASGRPIEVEEGRSIILSGKNISRFLITQPEIFSAEKKGDDQLLVTAKNIGYSYLHVWDDSGRSTVEFLGVFARPTGPTLEEEARKEAGRSRPFKLKYSLDWYTLEDGRRIDELERSGTYTWTHSIGLTGESPYGNIDSAATVRKIQNSTDLTYATLGITNGKLGPFEGFTLRAGDYTPSFSNLAFPGATLRGVMFNSPAFSRKFDYTLFWGRESGGLATGYGGLSPELYKSENAFLAGYNMSFTPSKHQNYKFTVTHGWGRDREDYLGSYDYDLQSNWNFDRWGLGYEVAHDTETFAHKLTSRFNLPKLNITSELRNVDKQFYSITGNGWEQGEIGGLVNVDYRPTDKLTMTSRMDIYKDRLYPSPDNTNRLNEDLDMGFTYRYDPLTTFDTGYSLQNDLGQISASRYQSATAGVSKGFTFWRGANASLRYTHQENTNYTAHTLDYVNEKVFAGFRINLIGGFYYYVNEELNWLNERYYANNTTPTVFETGVDWSSRLGNSPIYNNFRFTYRDEEHADSNLSFLSGEDYIEGYSELAYRPGTGSEIYGSCRVRNTWAEKGGVEKRVEASFNAGMRYIWDTGLRWDTVGDIEGYVFKDMNSDGLRQRDDPPVEGVKVWLGKTRSAVTDIFGYFKFKGVRGAKAFINVDTASLPKGFLLTVPARQEVPIKQHQISRVNFGATSRSEIRGMVFEDINADGKFTSGDKPVENIVVLLDDQKRSISDISGRYAFTNASPGEHALAVNLDSIPVYFLPEVAITKKITLFEGASYVFDIPLKRVKQK